MGIAVTSWIGFWTRATITTTHNSLATNSSNNSNPADGTDTGDTQAEDGITDHASSFSCNSAIVTPPKASSVNGAEGSGGGTGKRKRDYDIPEQPPSEAGLENQRRWRENQKPSVEMHALLYGRLPAGYKAAKVSLPSSDAGDAPLAKDSFSDAPTPPTTTSSSSSPSKSFAED